MVFTRISPVSMEYELMEFDPQGFVVGEGSALLEGSTLYIPYGSNYYIGEYEAQMKVSDSQMTGVIQDLFGNQAELFLYR